jgi:hypothetical protein
LGPAAASLRARGHRFFASGFDASRETYFTTRERVALGFAEFEFPSVSTAAELEERLLAMWSDEPAELNAIAGPLASFAWEIYELSEPTDEGDEVSDLVYPMF